jgi:hypothetical protein
MELRFFIDPESGQPHIYDHGITEEEVRQVMAKRGQDYPGSKNSRMKLGQTDAGRYLQVVYSPDEGTNSVFVITAYELRGKSLKAFRRRERRKPK